MADVSEWPGTAVQESDWPGAAIQESDWPGQAVAKKQPAASPVKSGELPNLALMRGGNVTSKTDPTAAIQLGKILDVGKETLNTALPGFYEQATTSPLPATHLQPTATDSTATAAGKAAMNTLTGTIEALTSPAMLATVAAGGAFPEVGKVLGAGFGVQQAAEIPSQIEQAVTAPTTQGKIEGGLGAALSSLFAVGGAKVAGGLSESLKPILGETATPEEVIASEGKNEAQSQGQEKAKDGVLTEPAPSVQSAAEPVAGTRISGPALVDTEGNIIAQGKLGETHADLLKQAMAGDDPEKALEAFTNDAQHVFVDDQGNKLDRTQAAELGVKSGQVPEGTTKVESQMLKPDETIASSEGTGGEAPASTTGATVGAQDEPAAQPTEPGTEPKPEGETTGEESTTGIAQRVHEQRAPGEIVPGEGSSPSDLVQRGRELLQGGADPEKIIAGVNEGKAVTGDEMAVLRAKVEEFSKVTDQTGEALRKNPNDPVLKQAAADAIKAETDFRKRIKPAATEASEVFRALQGETEVETGTFVGLRRAFVERTGRDVTPGESVTLEKTAEKVQKTNAEVEKTKADFSEVVKRETKGRKVKTAEELRAAFAEKFKKMLPCD